MQRQRVRHGVAQLSVPYVLDYHRVGVDATAGALEPGVPNAALKARVQIEKRQRSEIFYF